MKKQFLRTKFGFFKDKSPEIYEFLFSYIEKILKKLNIKKIDLIIKRLEPLNAVFTNLTTNDKKEIKKILRKYAKTHCLKVNNNNLHAKIKVKELSNILQDYNKLFDLFFSDIIIKSNKFTIDMMDAFNNSVLIIAKEKEINLFKKELKKLTKTKTRFENANPKTKN